MADTENLAEHKKEEYASVTKTVESGAFIRTTWRKGKKKHQDTVKIKVNQKKVVLGFIGDFEMYVYPFDYPDTVFLGKFPVSTQIKSTNVKEVLGAYNQMRWFLANGAFSKDGKRKGVNARRRTIQSAYNSGVLELRSKKRA
jgi:hypothetical protein